MDKYYTPSIEEFYVGFEYEALMLNDKWGEFIVTLSFEKWLRSIIPPQDLSLQEALDQNKIRVKYLDSEDIEGLGFKEVSDNVFQKESYHFCSNLIELKFWPNRGYNLIIYDPWGPPKGDNITLFDGIIKNKSELKKLLTQLGIEYENTSRSN